MNTPYETIDPPCFISFSESISNYPFPKKFTYPFNYQPHLLTELAAKELQLHIQDTSVWEEKYLDGSVVGKMFGVLIVQNTHSKIGYLVAYSGKHPSVSLSIPFVPSIFDRSQHGNFYTKGENELNKLNHRINELLQQPDFISLQNTLTLLTNESNQVFARKRKELKKAKQLRKIRREEGKATLSSEQHEILIERLKKESLDQQFEYKRELKNWKKRIEKVQLDVDAHLKKINILKSERKEKSAKLQQQLFDQYQFLSANGDSKGLSTIFKDSILQKPPSGAGDCAAPRLLQYAFQHRLKPIAMAEFWWGSSPKKEIRKHGHYYPACKSKCEPILGHMLQGLVVDENPILTRSTNHLTIETIFEDEHLLVIHKPTELLSVPGKNERDSVYLRIKERYPSATGPMIVHRLDMSTSGIMLIAKSKEVHHHLQQQFAKHIIKKKYIALLDGVLKNSCGTIDLPLRVDLENRPHQLVCFEHGKAARTHWEVIKVESNKTLIHFYPITGRTHQLRVHSAHPNGLNAPIYGDDLYGKKADRLYLHAEEISFVHPRSNEMMTLKVKALF